MKKWLPLLLLLLAVACAEKKKTEPKNFVAVVSLIEKQVAHVDSALYSIVRYDIRDSLHTDTSYIPREKFREQAAEFLALPDLSNPDVAERFKEEHLYDTMLRRVVLTYTPVNPKKEEIKKIELLLSTAQDDEGNNKATNLIVDRIVNNRDGFLQQKMMWRFDKSFLVVTTTQAPGKPESSTTKKVSWNEEPLP